ncbi:MAG: D-aminoacylase [Spirochaetales bacterium]|nr:D-aminoacylase [Spirochaetales bacterium]
MPEIVIRNATVYDGSGTEPIQTDIGIDECFICNVGNPGNGKTEIDATGLALAPGFIDVHTHDDVATIDNPEMPFKIFGGVTSCIVGNCGMGCAPVENTPRSGGILQRKESFPIFQSFLAYIEYLQSHKSSVNVGVLAGFGTLREFVMGQKKTEPTQAQLRQMKNLLADGISEGLLGLSTGLIYEPDIFATTEEIRDVASIMAGTGAPYVTHLRDEGKGLINSIEEALDIGEKAGVPVQLSHHKAAGSEAWGSVQDSLAMIEEAQARGTDIHADQYPYTAGSTVLKALVPKIAAGSYPPEVVVVSGAPNHPEWEGCTLPEVGTLMRVPWDAVVSRVLDLEPDVTVIAHIMNEEDVQEVMRHPSTMIGSDGIPVLGGKPHPRLYGSFARVLGRYARDLGLFSVSEAVYRMTGLPAKKFGLTGRGVIREGAYADVVIFNPETIIDRGTFENPHQYPDGIKQVFVNGSLTVRDGIHTGVRNGVFLRRCARPHNL